MNRRQMMMISATGATGAALTLGSQSAQPSPAQMTPNTALGTTPDTLLLKDFRPRSLYRIPITPITKAKYPVIDFHNIGLDWTPPPSGRANGLHWMVPPGSVDEAVKAMDDAGVEKAVVSGEWAPTPEEFSYFREIYSKYPDRFDIFCTFDLRAVNEPGFAQKAIKSLDECHRLGALGVGELTDKGAGMETGLGVMTPGEGKEGGRPPALGWSFKGAPHLDDDRLDPVVERCGQLGMPVLFHIADPFWSFQPIDNTNERFLDAYDWQVKVTPGMQDFEGMVGVLERAVSKHPSTTFVAAHYADQCHDFARLARLLDRYPNFYVETSARFATISTIPRIAARFFQGYADRILYATDFSLYNPETLRTTFRVLETSDDHFYPPGRFENDTWPLYGLGLPDAVLRKVYRDNALNLLKRARDAAKA